MCNTMGKRLLAFLLALLLLASFCTVSLAETEPEVRVLTLEDLKALNDGNLAYTTNDSGNITFLRGNFYDGVIEDGDDVVRALEGIGALLGMDESTGYVKGNRITDDQGYHYYMFYQWQGDSPVDYAIAKLIVDPEGKGVAVSSSMLSGVPANEEDMVAPEQALAVVKAYLAENEPNTKYTYYEDDITKTRTRRMNESGVYVLTLAYIVYTNNPGITLEDNGLAYLAHYVSATGKYLYSLPISSIGSEAAMKGNDVERIFEGKTAAEYSGTVVGQSGTTHEITVPVMLDESTGTYYLADITRKMVVADYWEYVYNNQNVTPLSSTDNTGWDGDALLAYENYILAYDFFDAIGWQGADGFGTPMLLLADFVDQDHNPIDNACYCGIDGGWQAFVVTSDLLNAGEALDVVGHEFTHCVTTSSVTKILYENQYGAINESMSDIMGNLIEMLSGRTDDMQWLMAETSGEVMRNMSDPNAMAQPESVGDVYFVPNAEIPTTANDNGGVHVNNTLLAGIAPKLYRAGMTLEEERLLWTTFICALTPRTGYAEAALILPFAAEIAGLGQHQEIIAEALDEINMNGTGLPNEPADGRAMVKATLPDTLNSNAIRAMLTDKEGNRCISYPEAGTVELTFYVPAGSYTAQFHLYDVESGRQELAIYYYDGAGWTEDETAAAPLELQDKETLELTLDGIVYPEMDAANQ